MIELPRALVVLLTAAAAVVTLAGIQAVGSIAGPVMLALVLVVAVAPIRGLLERKGAPTWLQVAVPFLVVLLVLAGMLAIVAVAATQLATIAPTYTDKFAALAAEARAFAAAIGLGADQIDKAINSFDPSRLLPVAQGLLAGALGAGSALFLIVVLSLTMNLDAPAFTRILRVAKVERPELHTALTTFASRIRRYLLVSTVFGIICAVLDVIALIVLSVPLPLLWGILALITNYVPNIGFILGLLPPALLALLDGGFSTMLLVILAYIVINVVVQSFVQPKFLGDAVGLSTTMTMVSLIVWAFVIGPLGALLAIPLSLLVRALVIDSDPSARFARALVSGEAPPQGRTPA
ncbi:AI-2E family transporter [Herbidospora sp. NBRC 101105]|uniref:AI-2E family transporter n=1 Tax=Herbidospora sp. NBRC 101105 TaxID=3032195 RepID=UPI0024A0A4E8|nr:AI-2E family transporter [Herbidospora sp. NBRC 101105]GLX98012.1 AI-2E family transporter [Herbidospora sp. NBRC 101105]